MIITLTLNPAVDKTLVLDTFHLEGMNRATGSILDPGGKGINVSKTIKALGGNSLAMGILAGGAGAFIEDALSDMEIGAAFTHIPGETRTNLKILCQDTKHTIEINEPGPVVSESDLVRLKQSLINVIDKGTIVVVAGSVPKGVDPTFYKKLVLDLKEAGATVILDADGELFRQGIEGCPDVIKPNLKELEAYLGHTINTKQNQCDVAGNEAVLSEVALGEIADHFLAKGIGQVIISLGSQGAYYKDNTGAWRANPIKVDAHSSVGAGDAFVGAYALALERKLEVEDRLRLAIATSAGAVATKGTKPPELVWVEAHMPDVVINRVR